MAHLVGLFGDCDDDEDEIEEQPHLPVAASTLFDVNNDSVARARIPVAGQKNGDDQRSSSSSLETEMPATLPPEVEEGNVEYKLKLLNPSDSRFEHLVTQMKWRLQEGKGEAIYEIGVEDCGMLTGLNDEDLDASLQTLNRMADRLGASMKVLRERVVDPPEPGRHHQRKRRASEVLIRKVPDDQQFIDLRLAVLGNVDAGKSTVLGVLTQGELDNGRGRARLNLFRHLHEIQSGRTSSISHEIMGFTSKGEVVNYSNCEDAEEICDRSTKLITLIDLAGHQKYLKTTIFGLTGYLPHFAMLVVSANTGLVGTTKEHLGFAIALGVPVFVVINKIDMCRASGINRTVEQLERLLKAPGCKRVPFTIKTEDDAITAASSFSTDKVTPIFIISCVTGRNMDLIRMFLNALPPLQNPSEREQLINELTEHQVDEVYSIPFVGTVLGGTLAKGMIREKDDLLLGPTDDGSFHTVSVHSIHRNRLPCRVVQAGQSCAVAVGDIGNIIPRKGMVLLSPEMKPTSCMTFEAELVLLFHSNYICKGFQATIHCGNIRQTAIIEKMDKSSLQTNQQATIQFRFIKQPEYLKPGARLLLREGQTKGMGHVLRTFPIDNVVLR
ncbi:GTP-binding protein 2-like [Tubulanus polymorphus]|uniref:GTP-binding protein 2-like n=1 Tax=Tubulanus polymorphus TaxID=672921 RepID=UPI003DA1E261